TQQHIGRLDVPVQLPLRVQVVEAAQHLAQDHRDVHLLEAARLHEVQRGPAAEVLHYYP
ncbi:unnamed protein product, partial [Plutella xylostella]